MLFQFLLGKRIFLLSYDPVERDWFDHTMNLGHTCGFNFDITPGCIESRGVWCLSSEF